METLSPHQRGTCPYCLGPLKSMIEGETGRRIEWRICDFCGAEFGPPWPEQQWTEPTSEPDWADVREPRPNRQALPNCL